MGGFVNSIEIVIANIAHYCYNLPMTTPPTAPFRILNIKALIADFRDGRVDESLKFKYLLAEFVLLMFFGSLNVQLPPEDGLTWLLTTTLLIAAVVIGTLYAFKKNQQGDNADFTARYIAVNFVVSMCFAVAYFGIMVALVIFYPLLEHTAFMSALGVDTALNLTLMAVVLGLYYYFVARYIGQIAETATPKQSADKSA